MKYITSDLHIKHDNTIKFAKRPTTIELHDEFIYSKFSHITDDDEVYHVGDLSFAKLSTTIDFLRNIKGKWKFIRGNHDKKNHLLTICHELGHEFLGDIYDLKYNGSHIVLCHYPLEDWNKRFHGSLHCHGHIHNNPFRQMDNRFNVCFDVEFRPFTLDEIVAKSVDFEK